MVKQVIIVDPHLKADDEYTVYKNAKDRGLLVADREGKPFVGHCWPGE
jgi:alpha 1,3-glucosidase